MRLCAAKAFRACNRQRLAVHDCGQSLVTRGSRQRPLPAHRQQFYSEVKEWSEQTQEDLLTPLNAKLLGPLERRAFSEAVPLPYVLLLGNHSSGEVARLSGANSTHTCSK